VIIIHKWEGTPSQDWYPWLRSVLEKRGVQAKVPEMPDTLHPKIGEWVSKLSEEIGTPDKDTYLVGHSMGCQTILRYLEALPAGKKIGGALLVAGFVTLIDGSVTPGKEGIIEPWLEKKIALGKAREHCNSFVSIFSDNDPYVGLDNVKTFEDELGSKVMIIPRAGHLGSEDGYKELHMALNELLKMMA
jgi:uncharacterized protein